MFGRLFPRRAAAFAAVSGILILLTAAGGLAAWRDGRAPSAYAQASRPPNDDFLYASELQAPFSPPASDALPVSLSQITAGATLEPGETAPCAPIGASVWFQFRADRAETIVVDTAGSDFDTVLAAYLMTDFVPSPPGGGVQALACDDNALGGQSRIALGVEPGKVYYVQASGKGGTTGTLRINADCQPACPPSNDNAEAAAGLDVYAFPYRDARSTSAATTEAGEPRGCADIGATVWYTLIAPTTLRVEITTAGSDFDTALAVYTSGALFSSPPGGALTTVACDDNALGRQSRVQFTASAGTMYWVQAGGARGARGSLVLNAGCVPACPPRSDNFGQWYGGPGTLEAYSTEGATDEPGEPHGCGNIAKTVWYGVGPSNRMRIAVETTGSDFDTVVAVYSAPLDMQGFDALRPVACSDPPGPGARATFEAQGYTANVMYWVQIGGKNGASGDLQVAIDCDPQPCPPYNNDIAQPAWLGFPGFPAGAGIQDTTNADLEPGEPADCGGMTRTIWARIEGVPRGTLTFDARGLTREFQPGGFPAAVAVYDVPADALPPTRTPAFGALRRLQCVVAPAADAGAHAEWEAQSGHVYYVQYAGAAGAGGQLDGIADCTGLCPPSNDDIGSAQLIFPPQVDVKRTTGATLEPDEPQACGAIRGSVWYRLDVGEGFELTVQARADFAPVLALYTPEGISPPGGLATAGCGAPVAGGAALDVSLESNRTYFLQVGGADAPGGNLTLTLQCTRGSCPAPQVFPVDTGGPGFGAGSGGGISLPDTGSGGYLPGVRR
jgi:hypothetical protein